MMRLKLAREKGAIRTPTTPERGDHANFEAIPYLQTPPFHSLLSISLSSSP
jgi:hypothetical protein